MQTHTYIRTYFVFNLIMPTLYSEEEDFHPQMQSKGQMFGLTFWENWYILSESNPTWQAKLGTLTPPMAMAGDVADTPELKLVYYTGHTLQGSYKGGIAHSHIDRFKLSIELVIYNLILLLRYV